MSDSDTKTIEQWEKEFGFITLDDADLKKKLTADEARQLALSDKVAPTNHEDRIKFLKDNGYPVNRATMIDSSLSAVTEAKDE